MQDFLQCIVPVRKNSLIKSRASIVEKEHKLTVFFWNLDFALFERIYIIMIK